MNILYYSETISDFERGRTALIEVPNLRFDHVINFENFKQKYDLNSYSAIISDCDLNKVLGVDLLKYVRKRDKLIPFIGISGRLNSKQAVELLREGLTDHVLKENINSLVFSLLRSLNAVDSVKEELLGVQKLKASEAKFRTLFNQAAVGVAQIETATGRFMHVNRKYCDLIGYNEEEMWALDFMKLTHHEDHDEDLENMTRLIKGEIDEFTIEKRLYTKNNSVVWIKLTVSPMWRSEDEPKFHIAIVENITEKKIAEFALKETEERFRSLFERMNEGLVLSLENGIISEVNPQFAKMVGYDVEELVGRIGYEFLLMREDTLRIKGKLVERKKGIHESYEVKLIKKSGEAIWVNISSSPIHNESGEFSRIMSVITDITKKKVQEDELKKSEEKFRKIFESITNVYYQADMAGTIIMVSPSCFKLCGYLPAELIGKSIINLFESPRVRKILLRSIIAEKNINNLETTLISKSQTLIYVSASINLLLDENNIPIGTQGIIRDITENKKQEQKLKNSLKLNQGIINSTDQLFYVVKIEDEKAHINPLTYVSPQSELFFGLSPQAIMSKPEIWFSSIHKEDVKQVIEKSKLLFANKEPVTRVYRIVHPFQTEEIWVEDYVYPLLDEFGKIQELYGSISNITPLKRKEIELEKLVQELTNRYNDLMQFNYIVSHNLRSPITNIIGLSNLVKSNQVTEEEKNEVIEHIGVSILKMDNLVKDLNMILATRSALDTRRQKINLVEMIEGISETLEDQIIRSNCVLRTVISPDSLEFFTIKSYLESILFNLMSNAIKYRSPYRDLLIGIATVRNGENIIITVSDNGLGIDMAMHGSYIFGLYKRFHTEQEGKGLGLHMTKTQVEAIGGSISVESIIDVGTKFTVVIPVKAVA